MVTLGKWKTFLVVGLAQILVLRMLNHQLSCVSFLKTQSQAIVHHFWVLTFCGYLLKHEVVLKVLALRC